MTTPAKQAGATLKSLMKKADDAIKKRLELLGINEIKHHPATAQAPGVFRVLPKTMMSMDNRFKRWSTTTTFGNIELKFRGVYLLDSFDQTMLLALMAYANKTDEVVSHETPTEVGKGLRVSLLTTTNGQASLFDDGPHIPVASVSKFSGYEITKWLTGGTSGKDYKRVMESLERLAATNVFVVREDYEMYSNVISGWGRSGDSFVVAVHPIMSEAIRGDGTGDGQYARMTLNRVLGLKTHAGKLLYPKLSTRVYEGQSQPFDLDTLVGWIFAHEPAEEGTLRLKKQREQVRTGMADIDHLEGWTIEQTYKGYRVDRNSPNR